MNKKFFTVLFIFCLGATSLMASERITFRLAVIMGDGDSHAARGGIKTQRGLTQKFKGGQPGHFMDFAVRFKGYELSSQTVKAETDYKRI